MRPLRCIDELTALRNALRREPTDDRPAIAVCNGPGCSAAGAQAVGDALRDAVQSRGLAERVDVRLTGCLGLCQGGPVMLLLPSRVFYQHVGVDDVDEILTRLVDGQPPVERLLYEDPDSGERIARQDDIPFYRPQLRRLLERHAVVTPGDVNDYLAQGGYAAAAKALTRMTPEAVIDEVTASGLRGRGGAGFPTGVKWGFCRKAGGDRRREAGDDGRVIICNADEGDPGAYMDRAVLEGDPHAVIEGMLIGAYAMGASRGVIYVRAEYPLAVRNATRALEQARELGLVGADILGTGFDLDLTICTGAGAFVCGEETALIASLEDRPGEPRPRPPFPAQAGLWGKPTNINNVETWANVPLIVEHGAEWFSSAGAERSKGTKIFSLVGAVRSTGLVEAPIGLTLRELIYDIGGGPLPGRRIKAVQTGGPSGGCLPAEVFDLPVDYESLAKAGSIMGSGGVIVLDDTTCMVDLAKFFLTFLAAESCGKCLPCREGVPRMLQIVTRICEGRGRPGDLELLEELGQMIKGAALCGLGQTAANPALSSLRYFRDEYETHIRDKHCPAKQCRGLFRYEIDAHACTGCGACARECPQEAVSGRRKEAHAIDQQACIQCGVCFQVCPSSAVVKV